MLEALEERTLMAAVVFDYSYDVSGFFADESGAPETPRAALVRAADDLTSRLNDTLAAIPAPTEANTWSASFLNPSNGDEMISLPNLEVPADTLIIFVGGRTFVDATKGYASTGFAWSGSAAWGETVVGRGQPGAVGPEEARTDVAPWGGSIGFDYTVGNYYFGEDAAGMAADQLDFYSLVQHEMGHLLGFTDGTDSFENQTDGETFVGNFAMDVFGGPVPLDPAGGHWQDGLVFQGGPTTMDPRLPSGVRVAFTALDWAALRDIGWEVAAEGFWTDGFWTDGSWTDGFWNDGYWTDGTTTEGFWTDGSWADGFWTDGSWIDGYWADDAWVEGYWADGYWTDGSWTEGFWTDGVTTEGYWTDGFWTDGAWADGYWTDGFWTAGA